MKRVASLALAALIAPALAHAQLTRDNQRSSKELIVVYLGAAGTDLQSGIIPLIREMEKAVRLEAATTQRTVVFRGVSLEQPASEAVKHLAQVAGFDEISAGGSWTNLAVVRYFGNEIAQKRETAVPQLILLERDVRWENSDRLVLSPEREVKRFIGLDEIADWVKAGSHIPK